MSIFSQNFISAFGCCEVECLRYERTWLQHPNLSLLRCLYLLRNKHHNISHPAPSDRTGYSHCTRNAGRLALCSERRTLATITPNAFRKSSWRWNPFCIYPASNRKKYFYIRCYSTANLSPVELRGSSLCRPPSVYLRINLYCWFDAYTLAKCCDWIKNWAENIPVFFKIAPVCCN